MQAGWDGHGHGLEQGREWGKWTVHELGNGDRPHECCSPGYIAWPRLLLNH